MRSLAFVQAAMNARKPSGLSSMRRQSFVDEAFHYNTRSALANLEVHASQCAALMRRFTFRESRIGTPGNDQYSSCLG